MCAATEALTHHVRTRLCAGRQGDHISIMSHGKEVAAGTPLHLKNSLGGGYQVKLVTKQGRVAMVKQEVKRAMPSAKLVDDSAGSLSYTVPPEAVREIPPFFAWVEQEQVRPVLCVGAGVWRGRGVRGVHGVCNTPTGAVPL